MMEGRNIEKPSLVKARVISRTLGLDMKIGDVEYQADLKKATFFYTSDGWVDFRELVKQYEAIQLLVKHQEDMRDGRRIELTVTGKPKSYRAEVHHALYDKLINIGDKLLRYGYGRVPEVNIIEERKPQALIVNLTKKGETYIVNEDDVVQPSIDDDTDDWSDNENTNRV